MKRILLTLLLFAAFITPSFSQEYLEIVSLVSDNGEHATFTSVGCAKSKSDMEENAIKSLFHTLLFKGVEGVNNGFPLVNEPNILYTEQFFNEKERYVSFTFIDDVEKLGSVHKAADGKNQRTFKIKIKLKELIADVERSTGGKKVKPISPKRTPKIIVVPFIENKKKETYASVLNNDFDMRVACAEVQKGFNSLDIETDDILAIIQSTEKRGNFERNAADSNDKQLLLMSDADVYVEVDLQKEESNRGTTISLRLIAKETATGKVWATQNSWAGPSKAEVSILCAKAAKSQMESFCEQIVNAYNDPVRGNIQFAINDDLTVTMRDRCKSGKRISMAIQNWLDDNAENGDYTPRGVGDKIATFDKVQFPMNDKRGKRMTTEKFATMLVDDLYEQHGIDCDYVTDGYNIIITIMNVKEDQ